MSKEKYYPPSHGEEKFHCPHCDVFAKQFWAHIRADNIYGGNNSIRELSHFSENLDGKWTISRCEHCNKYIIWLGDKIIFPRKIEVENPNEDLEKEIQKDYLEAANVLNESPRSSAAILRLALQKLCKQLGEKGRDINNDIGELVKKGLNSTIQRSLDTLRITGNNAVHPGEIDLKDDKETVLKLFKLLNFIADKMITEPKEINSFYEELPEKTKIAVDKRDNVSK